MKLLREILYKVEINSVVGNTSLSINKIEFDSRLISDGDMYIAITGVNVDGHSFISQAIKNGANCIVCEKIPDNKTDGVVYVNVKSSRKALAIISSNYFDNPSSKLNLIGVTGTNGKTTIATLLFDLYTELEIKSGLISTVKISYDNKNFQANQTTPDSLSINRFLSEMVNSNVRYCFMEVSSHGIDQNRTDGLVFKGGIFTNLTHDHLDYHESFENYRDTKKQFFDSLSNNSFALTNNDDKNGMVMLQNTIADKYTYSLNSVSDFKAKILESSFDGMLLKINSTEFWSKLVGKFNAYNILSVYSAASILGLPKNELLKAMSSLDAVAGRFQFYKKNKITAIVDYAHTPDALENILKSINEIKTSENNLITVVGCGGNRDKSKRPLMGDIASNLSSKVIFTSDNPRFEDPEIIIEEMISGVRSTNSNKTISISNRKEAIKAACQFARTNDIILVAGKGHESYQEVKGVRSDFDDFEIVKELLNQKN
ncbi:MAG: UDP-N-acetylmuramoyl-L-alanyl-D-glutamate--2,6-diaminopimelate ligase [Flavobacteriales bacterium]|nr:MAG: UDP-N-acetylmuramoyl-L-alanyl-D-glutamate--2,6-diaminopimelate ligase [Flavobacteriales bacterium]